jgi:hypothetical protein
MSRKLSGTTGSSLLVTVSQRLHLKHKPDDDRYDADASHIGASGRSYPIVRRITTPQYGCFVQDRGMNWLNQGLDRR